MWGLESRSRTSGSRSRLVSKFEPGLGLVSKFEPGLGLGLGGYGLDYITGAQRLSNRDQVRLKAEAGHVP